MSAFPLSIEKREGERREKRRREIPVQKFVKCAQKWSFSHFAYPLEVDNRASSPVYKGTGYMVALRDRDVCLFIAMLAPKNILRRGMINLENVCVVRCGGPGAMACFPKTGVKV